MRSAHIKRERPLLMSQPGLGLAIEGGEHEDANLKSTLVVRGRRR